MKPPLLCLTSLAISFICLFSNNAIANPGDSCSNAISLSPLPVAILDSAKVQSVKWYSFTAIAHNIDISTNGANNNPVNIQSIVLYDSCGGPVIDSVFVGNLLQDSLEMHVSHLRRMHTYYLAVYTPACMYCTNKVEYALRISANHNNPTYINASPAFALSGCGLNYAISSVATHERTQGACAITTTGPYNFNITNIPSGAIIVKAFLLWGVIGNITPLAAQTFTLAPPAANSNPPLSYNATSSFTPLLTNPATCWEYDYFTYPWFKLSTPGNTTEEFESDITTYISGLKQTNGTYTISGLPYYNPANPGPDADGATLIIVYEDPCANYTGYFNLTSQYDVNEQPGQLWEYVMDFPPSHVPASGANGNAFFIAGDIQSCTYDTWNINLGANYLFNGSAILPVTMNTTASMWNTVVKNITYTSGQSKMIFDIDNTPPLRVSTDCFDMFAMGTYYSVPNSKNEVCASLSVNPSNVTICDNSSTTLIVNLSGTVPGINYIWSPATGLSATAGTSVVASPTVTTTYTVQAYNDAGSEIPCLKSTVTVNVATITINGPQTVCAGRCIGCGTESRASLTPGYYLTFTTSQTGFPCSGPYSYTWSNNGTGTVVVLNNTSPTYEIEVPLADVPNNFTVSVTVCCGSGVSKY